MSIKKAVSKAINMQGSRFNYTFNVKNIGALDTTSSPTAYNVMVSDNFPVGVAPTNSYWIQAIRGNADGGKSPGCAANELHTLLSFHVASRCCIRTAGVL
jgi:archaellum component FlaG (FlaF/FlaG flagellin family)